MQQPDEQYSRSVQSSEVVQGWLSPGQVFSPLHSAGRAASVWPGQRVQPVGSQAPPLQSMFVVQVGQTVSSDSWSTVQSGATAGLVRTS